jgi:O-antigen ligase
MASAEREPLDLWTIVRCGLSAMAVVTLYSSAARYIHNELHGPKPLFIILASIAGAAALLATDPHRPAQTFRSPLVIWAYLYLIMSTASALWRTSFTAVADQALIDRYRSMAFLVAMLVVFEDRRALRMARLGVIVVALASSVVNIAEALGAFHFVDAANRTQGRAAGLYVNPNQSGIAIVLGLAAGITAVPRALRVPVLLALGCGVAATFSRGSMLGLAVVAIVLLLRRDVGALGTAGAAVAVAAALVLTGGRIERLLDGGMPLTEDVLARLTMTASDSGRGALARRVWGMFLDAPWLGNGLGSENEGRISHNLYLSLAAEHGIVGLLTYPAMLVALIFRNRAAVTVAAVLLVAGVFSHNVLEEEPALICVALAAAAAHGARTEATASPAPGALPRPVGAS